MRITDILSRELVIPDLEAEDKASTLRELSVHLAAQVDEVAEPLVVSSLLERERLGSTGVGEGVAIPHTKVAGLKRLIAAFGRSSKGISFDAIDNQPVYLVFVLLVPENSAGVHLKALARVSRLLKDRAFRQSLLELDDRDALFDAFVSEDAKR
ncbi:MAG: PTS sugar transporter subunit IIA [Myxococcota bacterium]